MVYGCLKITINHSSNKRKLYGRYLIHFLACIEADYEFNFDYLKMCKHVNMLYQNIMKMHINVYCISIFKKCILCNNPIYIY